MVWQSCPRSLTHFTRSTHLPGHPDTPTGLMSNSIPGPRLGQIGGTVPAWGCAWSTGQSLGAVLLLRKVLGGGATLSTLQMPAPVFPSSSPQPWSSSVGPIARARPWFPRRPVPVLVPSALVHVRRRVGRPGPGPLTLRRAEGSAAGSTLSLPPTSGCNAAATANNHWVFSPC